MIIIIMPYDTNNTDNENTNHISKYSNTINDTLGAPWSRGLGRWRESTRSRRLAEADIYIYIYIYIYICIYIYIYTCVLIYRYVTYVYIDTHVCIYIYIWRGCQTVAHQMSSRRSWKHRLRRKARMQKTPFATSTFSDEKLLCDVGGRSLNGVLGKAAIIISRTSCGFRNLNSFEQFQGETLV